MQNGLSNLNRRNILTILGLASANTAAVAAEKFSTLPSFAAPSLMQPSLEAQEKIASALEHMAAAIRSGELTGIELNINSSVKMNQWIMHEVRIVCEVGDQPKEAIS